MRCSKAPGALQAEGRRLIWRCSPSDSVRRSVTSGTASNSGSVPGSGRRRRIMGFWGAMVGAGEIRRMRWKVSRTDSARERRVFRSFLSKPNAMNVPLVNWDRLEAAKMGPDGGGDARHSTPQASRASKRAGREHRHMRANVTRSGRRGKAAG